MKETEMFSNWEDDIMCPYCGTVFKMHLGEDQCSTCGKPYKVLTKYLTIKLEPNEEDITRFCRMVTSSLSGYAVESGISHILDEDLLLLFQMKESEHKSEILKYLLRDEASNRYGWRSDLIHLISRIPASLISQEAFDLMVENLKLDNAGVTDNIVQCFGAWEDQRSYDVLKGLNTRWNWINKTIQKELERFKKYDYIRGEA
jgi:hypothetical protein